MNIILDAMGGDNAPDANIKGAIRAINQIDAEITLVGKEKIIRNRIKEIYKKEIEEISPRLKIKNATETIEMEDKPTDAIRPAILEDSVEAVIAAIYLDGGIEEANKFIITNFKNPISEATNHVGVKDYKTVLQEKLQIHGNVLIEYKIVHESGPDHNKTFTAEVYCNGNFLASGIGTTKKHAEAAAAQKALENL